MTTNTLLMVTMNMIPTMFRYFYWAYKFTSLGI